MYKTVWCSRLQEHFFDYWLCSVLNYALKKRNEMPQIKGKKCTNHVDLTPLKTQESWLCVPLWQAGRQAGSSPSLRPGAVSSSVATRQQPGWHSACPPTWRSPFVRGGHLNLYFL